MIDLPAGTYQLATAFSTGGDGSVQGLPLFGEQRTRVLDARAG